MKRTPLLCLCLLAGLIAVSACRPATEPPPATLSPVSVVPLPQMAVLEPGSFTITAQASVVVESQEPAVMAAARSLADKLGPAAGAAFSVSQGSAAPAAPGFFFKTAADPALAAEAYRLHAEAELRRSLAAPSEEALRRYFYTKEEAPELY